MTFSPTESRYTTYDRELLALVWAVTSWRHLILGCRVEVWTDSKAVTFLKSQPTLSDRQARALEKLAEFNLVIQHIAGVKNEAADALTRIPCNVIGESWVTLYQQDRWVRDRFLLEDGTPKSFAMLKDGRLHFEGRIIVPEPEVSGVIISAHGDGHWGVAKTLELCKRRFLFPNMVARVKRIVETCEICQRTKASRQ